MWYAYHHVLQHAEFVYLPLHQILEQCPTAVAGVRDEIFQLLAAVAAKPLDRYQDNFRSEQRAKMNAFAILRASGRDAHRVLRRTAGLGK